MTSAKAERLKKKTSIQLPARIERVIQTHIPFNEMAKLTQVSKHHYAWFQPALNDARAALPLLRSVVHSDCNTLMQQVQKNPELFFKKGKVTDPDGQTFYNVSAYQLMVFLCDVDAHNKVMPLLPKTINEQIGDRVVAIETEARRQRQFAELGSSGGADLVRMNRNPCTAAFEEVSQFHTSYIIERQQHGVVFPLLENPDGIIYYEDENKEINLFYANKETQTVQLITLSPQQRRTLNSLFTSFAAMELNSSRRSSNEEHALIARTLGRTLSRQGILYTQGGIGYRDYRMHFTYINAARAFLRIERKTNAKRTREAWCEGVGRAQRQVLWLLARTCEQERPYYPLPNFEASEFQRGFTIYNRMTKTLNLVFENGKLDAALGKGFALYKGRGIGAVASAGDCSPITRRGGDLIAINCLIERAKARFRPLVKETEAVESPLNSGLGLG